MPPQEEIWSLSRRLAQPFLASLAETELSGTAILDLLRGEELGYRMTNFFADLRRYREIGVQKSYVKALDPSSSVPRSWMVQQPSEIWHIPEPHKGVFDVYSFDSQTGVTDILTYDVGFEGEISKEEAEEFVQDILPWEVYEPGRDIVGVDLIGWKHKAGEMY